MDDVTFVAELPTPRRRRRAGGFFLMLGAVLCLAGVFGARWWRLHDRSGVVSIGLMASESCEAGVCTSIDDDEIAALGDGNHARLRAWLGKRTPAAASVIALALASAVLALWSFASPPRRGLHAMSIVVMGSMLVAIVCVLRLVLGPPVEVTSESARLVHVAFADLTLGTILVLASCTRSPPIPVVGQRN